MNKIIAVGFLLLVSSCKTYLIPIDSFRVQLSNSKIASTQDVKINNPLFLSNISYQANTIKYIKVVDKKGEKFSLRNSASIEMRVTRKNGKKTIFYFDTVTLQYNYLRGGRSRFIPSLVKEIHIDSIAKIEIQDGRKGFNYQ
jgi:hypothetical protein